jgi:flagellum-specific peptidoglycan hydrolase FlgJ
MSPDDFIAMLAPAAKQSMSFTNVPASFVVAEGALESGWGTSDLCIQARNIFGVKADPSWHGPTCTMNTREFVNNNWVMVPALWRSYPDWNGCIADHAQFFLSNPRYAACFETVGGEAFARAVAAAGYATDPQYADKVIAVMRAHNLAQCDVLPAVAVAASETAPMNF